MNAVLRLENLSKSFAGTPVVRNLHLTISSGEFFTFLGPSGCGKTTTLRMIAGFEAPTEGRIFLEHKDITELAPFRRDVNTVFQNYALFPHMTVAKNISFGLEMRRVGKEETTKRVSKMLELFSLTGLGSRKPSQLSGGQQQRVAVARSLVLNPRVLLLDEPLAALDAKLRRQIQIELKEIQKSSGVTFLYVTHDQEEALLLSDRIAVMRDGVLEQVGTPRKVYEQPATRFVAEFVGENNLLPARIVACQNGELLLDVHGLRAVCTTGSSIPSSETWGEAVLAIRPESFSLHRHSPDALNCFAGVVRECLYSGTNLRVIVQLDCGQRLLVQVASGSGFRTGERVWAEWQPADGQVVSEESGVNTVPELKAQESSARRGCAG